MENISISNLCLLQNLAGAPLGYPVNRAVTAPWKHLCAHICVFLGACLAGLFFTRHDPLLLVKYEALSDYDDLVKRICLNGTARYLCSNIAVLALHMGWVRGIVNCDRNPAFFMSLPATQHVHSAL